MNELITHSLRALQDCLPSEVELTSKNCCLSIVGKDMDFTTYENDAVAPYLAALDENGDEAAPAEAAAMEVEANSG